MPIPILIIGFFVVVAVSAKNKQQKQAASPVPPPQLGIAQHNGACMMIAGSGTVRGNPQAQVEAANISKPGVSDALMHVVPGIGYDVADSAIEGLFA